MATDGQTLLDGRTPPISEPGEAEGAGLGGGLRRSPACAGLIKAAGLPKLRRLCLALSLRLEGGQFYSYSARCIMERQYGVVIGAFSYGFCFQPGAFPPGVRVGRYVSIADEVTIILRNHPTSWLSTHPFFFDQRLRYVDRDRVAFGKLEIQHDAWIGHRVTITPGCSRIGIGAVVGAAAVVTKDVPDFAVVAGNPARVLKYRFPEDIQHAILRSAWWNCPIQECVFHLQEVTKPLADAAAIESLTRKLWQVYRRGKQPDRQSKAQAMERNER